MGDDGDETPARGGHDRDPWTVGDPISDGTSAGCGASPVESELRDRLLRDARSALERVESEHGPAPRLPPAPFGPRPHDPAEPPSTVEGQRERLAGIAGTVLVDGRPGRPSAPRVALVRRTYADGWVSPGGAVEPGESLPAAAVRETTEETGLDVELTGLFYGRLVEHEYAAGGSLPVPMAVFTARATGGSLADRSDHRLPDGRPELAAAEWFPVDELPADAVDRERIRDRFGE